MLVEAVRMCLATWACTLGDRSPTYSLHTASASLTAGRSTPRQHFPSAPEVRVPPTSAGSALRSNRAAKSGDANASAPECTLIVDFIRSLVRKVCLNMRKTPTPIMLHLTQCDVASKDGTATVASPNLCGKGAHSQITRLLWQRASNHGI